MPSPSNASRDSPSERPDDESSVLNPEEEVYYALYAIFMQTLVYAGWQNITSAEEETLREECTRLLSKMSDSKELAKYIEAVCRRAHTSLVESICIHVGLQDSSDDGDGSSEDTMLVDKKRYRLAKIVRDAILSLHLTDSTFESIDDVRAHFNDMCAENELGPLFAGDHDDKFEDDAATRTRAQAIRAARDESTGILEITAYAQLFAIGDVHGDLPRLVSVLHAIGVVALDHDDRVRWVAPPGTVVVQVGDQIDSEVRDPGAEDPDWETSEGSNDLHVVEFMTAIREIAERAGSMVVSCIGNHEWMNLSGDFSYVSPASIRASGGAESRRRLLASQRAGPYVQRHFAHREIACRVGRYLFSHAGIRPWHIARLGPAVRDFRRWVRGESHGMSEQTREFLSHPDGPLWTREFTGAGSANSRNGTDTVLRALRAEKMVVGHTVVPVATWFGKVLAIDTGMSRSLGGNDAFVLSSSVWRGDAILRVGFGRTGRIEKGRDVDVDVTDERAYTRFSVPWTE